MRKFFIPCLLRNGVKAIAFRVFIICLLLSLLVSVILTLFWADFVPPTRPENEKFTSIDGVANLSETRDFRCVLDVEAAFGTQCKTIRFFNADGSLWREFDWKNGFAESKGSDFAVQPFAYSPDYDVLVFRMVGRSANWIEMIVDENRDTRKFIRTSSWRINIQDWPTHILLRSSIDAFGQPVFDKPDGEILGRFAYTNVKMTPIEVRGDWVMVRLIERQGSSGNKSRISTGLEASDRPFVWIKWRDGEKILIGLFYFA